MSHLVRVVFGPHRLDIRLGDLLAALLQEPHKPDALASRAAVLLDHARLEGLERRGAKGRDGMGRPIEGRRRGGRRMARRGALRLGGGTKG